MVSSSLLNIAASTAVGLLLGWLGHSLVLKRKPITVVQHTIDTSLIADDVPALSMDKNVGTDPAVSDEEASSQYESELSDFEGEEGDGDFLADAYPKHKLLLCVRTDLKMGTGKIAAQCGHATLGAYRLAKRRAPKVLKYWERSGQAKIVVRLPDEETMKMIEMTASTVGILTHVVVDAGRTQIAAGTKTVLAIGPGPNELIDAVCSELKLY